MKIIKLVSTLSVAGLLCLASAVQADEIIITHQSGKVQVIKIEQSNDPVDQVSFRRSKATAPQAQQQTQAVPSPVVESKSATAAPIAVAAPSVANSTKAPETVKTPNKSGVKIKWAAPMDSMY